MNKLIATASALALLAGTGIGYAAGPTGDTNAGVPSATMPSSTAMPSEAAPMTLSEDQIRQAQQQLQTAGLYRGQIDGKIGPETKQAIERLQQQKGLPATGSLDQQTMAALSSGTSSSGSGMAPATPPGNAGGMNARPNTSPQPGAAGSMNPSAVPNTTGR